jgi:hypothetical protein
VITGHLGIAAAAHSTRRDSTLVWLAGAAMAPDVVDGLFVLARICNPNGLYSHTVPAAALLAALVGAMAFLTTGQRATGLLCALLVLAHLPPDFITGHKLFWPGGEIIGLRLYDWPILDFLLESVIVAAGWWMMRRRDWAPRWATGTAALVSLLVLQASADVIGASRGGMKPSVCSEAPARANAPAATA